MMLAAVRPMQPYVRACMLFVLSSAHGFAAQSEHPLLLGGPLNPNWLGTVPSLQAISLRLLETAPHTCSALHTEVLLGGALASVSSSTQTCA